MKTLKYHMGVLENKCTSVEAKCGSDAYNPSTGKRGRGTVSQEKSELQVYFQVSQHIWAAELYLY